MTIYHASFLHVIPCSRGACNQLLDAEPEHFDAGHVGRGEFTVPRADNHKHNYTAVHLTWPASTLIQAANMHTAGSC